MLNNLLKICKFKKDRELIKDILNYRNFVLSNNKFLKKKKIYFKFQKF